MSALVMENMALLSLAPEGIPRLRALILDLAIRGNLITRHQDDEPVSLAISRIEQAKRAKLSKAELAKFDVLAAAPIVAEPFPLPISWQWRRLGAIGLVASSSRVHQKDWTPAGVPFYRTREIVQLASTGAVVPDLFISEKLFSELVARSPGPTTGDIMITGVGTIGVPYVVQAEDRFYFKDASVLIFKNYFDFFPNYLALLFKSPYWRETIHRESMGTTVHTLTISRANEVLVPIPPKDEQHRIVAKVDELMALCDRLEARQQDAEAAHARLVQALLDSLTQARDAQEFQAGWERLAGEFEWVFTTDASVDKLKLTICQMGISGKLVPSVDTGDNISELIANLTSYWRDRKNRRAALAAVAEADQRYKLPQNWGWLYFGFLSETRLGKMLDAAKNRGDLKPYLRNTNVQWGRFELDDLKELRLDVTELDEYSVKVGDLLICEGGEPGRCAVWRDANREIYFQKALHRARPLFGISADYLKLCLQVDAENGVLSQLFTGATIKHLTGEKLERYAVPIPLPEEQRRIVAKVSELLALCDQLKAKIAAGRAKQAQLAEALVKQAVAAAG